MLTVDIIYRDHRRRFSSDAEAGGFHEVDHPRDPEGKFASVGKARYGIQPRLAGQPPRDLLPSSKQTHNLLEQWGMGTQAELRKLQGNEQFANRLTGVPQYAGPLHRGAAVHRASLSILKPGKHLELGGNLSASTEEEAAASFAEPAPDKAKTHAPVIFHIPNGRGADLASINYGNTERQKELQEAFRGVGEVIMPKATQFKIHKVERRGGVHHVTLHQLRDKHERD